PDVRSRTEIRCATARGPGDPASRRSVLGRSPHAAAHISPVLVIPTVGSGQSELRLLAFFLLPINGWSVSTTSQRSYILAPPDDFRLPVKHGLKFQRPLSGHTSLRQDMCRCCYCYSALFQRPLSGHTSLRQRRTPTATR